MPEIAELAGLWRRSLIMEPDGSRDETSLVDWLQGPSLYVDLRSPLGRPDFSSVSGFEDLSPEQVAFLARQQGFAGRLVRDAPFFNWERTIDLQPPGPFPDSGTLAFDGDIMIEHGRHAAYIEHWRRGPEPTVPSAACRLLDADGTEAVLVVAGALFAFARARPSPLPAGLSLEDCAGGAAAKSISALFDCEIAIGAVDGGSFVVSRSSLPWREGTALRPALAGDAIELSEGPRRRRWTIVEAEGDETAFPR